MRLFIRCIPVTSPGLAATATPSTFAYNHDQHRYGKFTFRGTVTRVMDGDTLDVRLTSGTRTRVRLIGIDTPERRDCYAAKATSRARTLALGERVVLRGDPTQDTRDRFDRLLAYVSLPGRRDLGLQLIRGGFGEVFVFETPFRRLVPTEMPSRQPEARASGSGARA